MSLKTSLNGTFGLDELKQLKSPIAWCGTKPISEQVSKEAEFFGLINDAIGRLEMAYENMGTDVFDFGVEITSGEIGDVVTV